MLYPFNALLARMKYITRWSLMHSLRAESLSEHTCDTALIAHTLCLIARRYTGTPCRPKTVTVAALYHDASEIITGDMPTPVKYHDGDIRDAYKAVERNAEDRLLATLPDDLRPSFENVFRPAEDAGEDELYLRHLVKAADKISALIKCVDERRAGNAEFSSAERTCRAAVEDMASELPEVADFIREFLPSYGATLDELL